MWEDTSSAKGMQASGRIPAVQGMQACGRIPAVQKECKHVGGYQRCKESKHVREAGHACALA